MNIVTAGRTELDDLFTKSDVLDLKLTMTPFLAFVTAGDTVNVAIMERAADVALLPADTPVMVQWTGRWHSDFFQMTAGDVRMALEERAKKP